MDMKCEQTIVTKGGMTGRNVKKWKCGKPATNVDEAQRGLCLKHFKKWYKKKFGTEYSLDSQ